MNRQWNENDSRASDCAMRATTSAECTCGKLDALAAAEGGHRLTLKEWKACLAVGTKLRCTFRWYWNQPHHKPAPSDGFELCELIEVRATQCIMRTPTAARSFLYYPNACNLKATARGFELYFPDNDKEGYLRGKLMSRYEYI